MRLALLVMVLLATRATAGTLVVVVDRAMPQDNLDAVTHALDRALDAVEPDQQVAIIAAGATATVPVALRPVSRHRARLAPLQRSDASGVVSGLRAAAAMLAQARLIKPQVLVITNDDGELGIGDAMRSLRSANIPVSALGYQSLNRLTLDLIAERGHGRVTVADSEGGILTEVAGMVRSTPAARDRDVAAVFVIDRSGAMGWRLDIARLVAHAGVAALSPSDLVAVVGYDSKATIYTTAQRAGNRMRIDNEIERIPVGGTANIYAGLAEARGILQGINADVKVVYLLTDGESATDGLAELVRDMHDEHVQLTVVGIGSTRRDVLSMIAEANDGRLYLIEDSAAGVGWSWR